MTTGVRKDSDDVLEAAECPCFDLNRRRAVRLCGCFEMMVVLSHRESGTERKLG